MRRYGLCAVALLGAVTLPAQSRRVERSAADASIAVGRLDAAEQELYAAVRRAPREPSARGALGEFLASRGRIRAGSVLLEEARQFGADPRRIEPPRSTRGSASGACSMVSPSPGSTNRRVTASGG